ncbi:MAG: hypothetical protein ACREDH_09235 [Methylocella sp.]
MMEHGSCLCTGVEGRPKLHSRCKNTPFDEARMEGKVKLTMVAGEIVFEAE